MRPMGPAARQRQRAQRVGQPETVVAGESESSAAQKRNEHWRVYQSRHLRKVKNNQKIEFGFRSQETILAELTGLHAE